MHELYQLKEMLMKELEEYGSKGEMTAGSLEVVDKLAHAIKNLDKIIEAKEEEEYSMEGGSYAGGGSMAYARASRGGQGGGQGGNRGGGGGQSNARGRSYAYARGRGRNARRDSMGRYASEGGYSGNEEMISELYELMEDSPDEKTRKEFEKFVKKIEMM